MLPPTIMAMPTSETMRPKAAMAASMMPKRTSHNVVRRTCQGAAPRVSRVGLRRASRCSTAEAVNAVMMGSPRMVRPSAMPGIEYNSSISPRGPRLETKAYTKRPMTTVGKDSMLSTKVRAARFPGNPHSPEKTGEDPEGHGRDDGQEGGIAVTRTAEKVWGSPVKSSTRAWRSPSRI
jgi:hypothetical protein